MAATTSNRCPEGRREEWREGKKEGRGKVATDRGHEDSVAGDTAALLDTGPT